MRQVVDVEAEIELMNSYAPYGDLISSEGSFDTAYGYTGELTDSSGLINLRARWYDTRTGRFISKDTWAGDYQNPITLGKWLYANANPVMYTDPSGNYVQAILAAIVPSLVGLTAGMVIGAAAGALLGSCMYEMALTGKCGCDVQQKALSMTRGDWITMNAVSGGLIAGYSLALAANGPVGLIILGASMIYVSVSDLIPAVNEIKNIGLTTCLLSRIFLDVAGLVFGVTNIAFGIRALRAYTTPLSWKVALPADIAKNFQNSQYTTTYLKDDITVYRAEGQRFGRWYGSKKPVSAVEAENLYNVAKYGNDLREVSTYKIPKGTYVFEGLVEGGTGWQFYVPDPLKSGITLLRTEPLPQ